MANLETNHNEVNSSQKIHLKLTANSCSVDI